MQGRGEHSGAAAARQCPASCAHDCRRARAEPGRTAPGSRTQFQDAGTAPVVARSACTHTRCPRVPGPKTEMPELARAQSARPRAGRHVRACPACERARARTELATTAVPTLTTTRFAFLSFCLLAGVMARTETWRCCQSAAAQARRVRRAPRALVSQSHCWMRAGWAGGGGRGRAPASAPPEKPRAPATTAAVNCGTSRRARSCPWRPIMAPPLRSMDFGPLFVGHPPRHGSAVPRIQHPRSAKIRSAE